MPYSTIDLVEMFEDLPDDIYELEENERVVVQVIVGDYMRDGDQYPSMTDRQAQAARTLRKHGTIRIIAKKRQRLR